MATFGAAVACAFALMGAGCHRGLERGAAAPAGPTRGFDVVERGETGPITALAVASPFLWAGGAPGLRRWDLKTGEYELVGDSPAEDAAVPDAAGGITAIALDDEGGAWVAGPKELGRWMPAKDDLRYVPKGSHGAITALAACRPLRDAGVWVGSSEGLVRFDEGRGFVPVEGVRDDRVTALSLDDSGRGVWAGTHAHGVFRVADDRGRPVAGGDAIVLDAVLGIAKTAAGTRVAAGNFGAEARLYALTMAGAEGFRAPTGQHVAAVVDHGGDAVLILGPPGQEQPHVVRPLAAGEFAPAGSVRFTSLARERSSRWVAVPLPLRVPAEVTVAASSGEELWVGTRRLGLARAAAGEPVALAGSELVGDAERLFVACVGRARCYVVTDGPEAWVTDGDHYRRVHVGEPAGAAVIALATDARGAIYAISAEAQPPGLAITKHAGGEGEGPGTWQIVQRVPLEMRAKQTLKATFAAMSPAGALWVGLRVSTGAGEGVGRGAVEIDLASGRAIEHRPMRAEEHASPEALPLPANLTGILFEGGDTWYASIGGISRWQEGQLRTWSENEGLASELVHAIGRGADGALWAGTSQGLVRFDGKDWRPLGTSEIAARGIATDGKGRVWIATSKGLRVVERAPGLAPPEREGAAARRDEPAAATLAPATATTVDPDHAPVIVAGDMRDVTVDRSGRVWAMSTTTIALVVER
jgi:hypothetical protein